MLQFSIGDKAVYQSQGIGEIIEIGTMQVGGASIEFYTLHIIEQGTTIRVPTKKAASVGLREIIDQTQVGEIYDILRGENTRPTDKAWNRRYRAYQERLKSGSVFDIARVVRDLRSLQEEKPLSFGERRMLNHARSLLVKEISMSTSRTEIGVAAELEALCVGNC